jgi:hypothetical protein
MFVLKKFRTQENIMYLRTPCLQGVRNVHPQIALDGDEWSALQIRCLYGWRNHPTCNLEGQLGVSQSHLECSHEYYAF